MNNELVAAEAEAVMRARRVVLDAKLREQARGKLDGPLIFWMLLLTLCGIGYAAWLKPGMAFFGGVFLLSGVMEWYERRMSRRLDAILELLERDGRLAAP
jgi:hypothetical protein